MRASTLEAASRKYPAETCEFPLQKTKIHFCVFSCFFGRLGASIRLDGKWVAGLLNLFVLVFRYRNRSALSYHYYCSSFGGNRELCDKAIGPSVFKSISVRASPLTPALLAFGLPLSYFPFSSNQCRAYLHFLSLLVLRLHWAGGCGAYWGWQYDD